MTRRAWLQERKPIRKRAHALGRFEILPRGGAHRSAHHRGQGPSGRQCDGRQAHPRPGSRPGRAALRPQSQGLQPDRSRPAPVALRRGHGDHHPAGPGPGAGPRRIPGGRGAPRRPGRLRQLLPGAAPAQAGATAPEAGAAAGRHAAGLQPGQARSRPDRRGDAADRRTPARRQAHRLPAAALRGAGLSEGEPAGEGPGGPAAPRHDRLRHDGHRAGRGVACRTARI